MARLKILSCGAHASIQDFGRPGYLAQGLSKSGAADCLALEEGAVLLGQVSGDGALEMAGFGGVFQAQGDMKIALTGAPMKAELDGTPLAWNAAHHLPDGAILRLGGVQAGTYAYLSVGGGFDTEVFLKARAAHHAIGIGEALVAGGTLPIGPDENPFISQKLDVEDRFQGGCVHIVASVQTDLFSLAERARFENTIFTRDIRANRMGIKLDFEGAPFQISNQLKILSEIIVPGDIQMTGDGRPFVLMPECQSTGGYPRIGTVLPSDLPKIAQASLDATITFKFLSIEQALEYQNQYTERVSQLSDRLHPLLQDPYKLPNLLSLQLIGGVVSAFDAGDTNQ